MVRQKYTISVRNQAEELRKAGRSYKEIYGLLRTPKSTLSTWFGPKYAHVFDRKTQLKHLAQIRILALAIKKKSKDLENIKLEKRISMEVGSYPLRNIGLLKSILTSLYWAEGAKTPGSPIIFANTDPRIAKLFIELLRRCYRIDEDKLRIRLHLHHYHNVTEAKQFWSKLLNVPLDKFGKIYIKKRSTVRKFRQNFKGICFIKYYDNYLRKEIMAIAYQLFEQIV